MLTMKKYLRTFTILLPVFSLMAIFLPFAVVAAPAPSDEEECAATIDFHPETLNLCSQGQMVTVFIELPEGCGDLEDIDISTVRLNDTVPALNHPSSVSDYDNDDVPDLMVKFDRAAVQSLLEPGDEVEIKVSGDTGNGIHFSGTDTIRTIKDCQGELPVWYLDTETTPDNYEMEKSGGPGDDGQTGCVSIEPGSSFIWLADQAAIADITFPGGVWVVEISTDSDWGKKGDKCEVSLGRWTNTGWIEITTTQTSVKWNNGQKFLTILLQADAVTINKDDYLALQITNTDTLSHQICAGEHSYLKSPDTDPGYPVPELAAGILFGLGMVGLVGYLGLRRRQAIHAKI